jgi:hypothetical protein
MRPALLVPLGLALAVASARADDESPRPPADRFRGAIGGPWLLEEVEATLLEEELEIDCSRMEAEDACRFSFRWRIANPGAEAIDLHGGCYTLYADEVRLRDGDERADALLSDEDAPLLDQRVLAGERVDALPYPIPEDVDRQGFERRIEGGGEARLEMSGLVVPGYQRPPSAWTPAAATRHLLTDVEVGGRPAETRGLEVRFAPRAVWNPERPVSIRIRLPEGWEFRARFVDPAAVRRVRTPPPPGEWRYEPDGDSTAAVLDAPAGVPPILEIHFVREAVTPFHSGGPIIGLGGTIGSGEDGFWARLGYEIAYPEFLLFSVVADTDFHTTLVLAPTLTVASSLMEPPYFPSFDFGLGLPLRVVGAFEVGVRVAAGLSWGPVGFSAVLDVYPGHAGESDPLAGLLQIGLLGLILI